MSLDCYAVHMSRSWPTFTTTTTTISTCVVNGSIKNKLITKKRKFALHWPADRRTHTHSPWWKFPPGKSRAHFDLIRTTAIKFNWAFQIEVIYQTNYHVWALCWRRPIVNFRMRWTVWLGRCACNGRSSENKKVTPPKYQQFTHMYVICYWQLISFDDIITT